MSDRPLRPRYTASISAAGHETASATTRQRLIEAAIDTFGKRGFEATTTRRLAQLAGTQLTAIAYHFVNKEGIYQAAADHIGRGVHGHMQAEVQRATALLQQGHLDHDAAVTAVGDLLHHFAEMLLGPNVPDSWSRFISREMVAPTTAFEHLFGAMSECAEALCALVAHAQGVLADTPRARVTAVTLMGQVLVFRSSRASAMRIAFKTGFTRTDLELVQHTIRENVRRILAS